MAGIKELVAERAKTHGDFSNTAQVAQTLKDALHFGDCRTRLTSVQNEALDNIMQKVARILTGDPNHRDAWVDLQGYAQLVIDRLPAGGSSESA